MSCATQTELNSLYPLPESKKKYNKENEERERKKKRWEKTSQRLEWDDFEQV